MSLIRGWKRWWRRWRGRNVVSARKRARLPTEERSVAGGRDSVGTDSKASPRPRAVPEDARPPLRLALQGGGSHGAFTWGVLDGLLQRDDFHVDAISGTSAGAVNAAVLATGWARAGREGARDALRRFWGDVGQAGGAYLLPLQAHAFGPPFDLDAIPGYDWASRFLRTLSPYDYNPLNLNPLRDVLERHVDVDALRAGPIRLFVTATSVRSGEARVFSGEELGLEQLLASACLPFLFQAVEIEGEAYWDGGYSGNPALYPLVEPGVDIDIVVVRINPAQRDGVPRRSTEIMDRVSEITFNASLLGELRMIGLLNDFQRQVAARDAIRECRVHVIADDVDLATLPASSRLRVDAGFVERLHGFGQAALARFLETHAMAMGGQRRRDIAGEGGSGSSEAGDVAAG